ncbi:MAG: hypothetical protein K6E54_11370 [Bacteroidaceae bacterium]|nr:hypothetical protein [Bacteroidaceae bacterium]
MLLEHESELKSFVDVVSVDAFMALRIKYHVRLNDFTQLMRLLQDREYRKFAHNYIDVMPRQRVIEKMRIDSIFQDSIDALLIPENHSISGKNISMALKMADKLQISRKKYAFLMDKAIGYARMKRENPTVSFASREMKVLKKVLGRKQIETVLNEKNRLDSHLKSYMIWNDLEKAKLTEELDSSAQMYLMEKYFSLDMFYRDYFVDDEEAMKNNLDELYRYRPRAVRMHDAMITRKRVDAEAKEEKKKKVSNTYAW